MLIIFSKMESYEVLFVFKATLALTLLRKIFQNAWSAIEGNSQKKSESAWKIIYYTFAELIGTTILFNSDFWENTSNHWVFVEEDRSSIRFYYLLQLSFYLHSLICHFLLEVRRKDHYIMLFHHLITVGLIYFSWEMYYFKIGVTVLVLHDICDIPLELSKFASYMKYEAMSVFYFVCLLIVWPISRLVLYPQKVLYSSLVETSNLNVGTIEYGLFNAALLSLFVLNIYWFHLIVQVAKRKIISKEMKDVRED